MKKILSFAFLCFAVDAKADYWTQKATYPGAGQELPVSFSIGDKGYAGCGSGASDFWEYDPSTDTWTQKVSIPGGVRRAGIGFSIGNKGYAGTGDGPLSDFYEYDPSANTWTAKASMTTARNFAEAFSIGDKGYVGGGNYLNDFWEYNPSTNTWTQKSSLPYAWWGHAAAFTVGDKGYFSTGLTPGFTADTWEYDPSANTWTQRAALPGGTRSDSRGFTICDKGYVMSGGEGPFYNDLWQFDPVLNTWIKKADIPTAGRDDGASFTIGDKGYFGLGQINGGTNTSDFWEYTPDAGCSFVVSNFSAADTSFCQNFCNDYFDLSTNSPTSWQWSFPGGNPSSSTLQNPSGICYAASGNYDVILIAGNSAGSDTIVISNFITVTPLPSVTIVQSNDTLYSSSGNSYQWYTGGNAINGATNDFYLPSTEDYYTVVITDANGCSASDTIFFSLTPQTSFAASDTTICQKFCMDFFDQSGNNPIGWQWSFPGGVPSSSAQQNPTQICYNNPGVYDVTLIATNAYGSDTLVLTGYITVYATPAFPTVTVNGYVLTSSYASSYQWQFNSVDIPGATNQSYTATQTGYYTVIITDENGCVSSTTVYVEITGIEKVRDDLGVSVYPNPSNGNFTLQFSKRITSEMISIDVINALGQTVFSIEENNPTFMKPIQLNGIAEGIYFIDVKSEDFYLRRKIIISQ